MDNEPFILVSQISYLTSSAEIWRGRQGLYVTDFVSPTKSAIELDIVHHFEIGGM